MEEYTFKSIPYLALIIGLGVIIASIMTETVGDLKEEQDYSSAAYGNQTLTWAGNNTGISFAVSPVSTSSVILYNNATKVNKGANYTVTQYQITITNASLIWNAINGTNLNSPNALVTDNLNVSFTYEYDSAERNISKKGLDGQQRLANWFPTIGLILGAILIISVLALMFPALRKRE